MKAVYYRKLAMYKTVLVVVNKWKTTWENSIGFTEDVDELIAYIKNIDDGMYAISASKAVTAKKKQCKEKLLATTLVLSGVGHSYASKQKNEALKVCFNWYESTLEKGTEEDVYLRCLRIAKNAVPIKAQLMDHNLPENGIEEVMQLAEEFKKMIPLPHIAIKNRVSKKQEVIALFRAGDEFLKLQLDSIMRTFIKPAPDFCLEYTVSREIGGWKKKKKKEEEE